MLVRPTRCNMPQQFRRHQFDARFDRKLNLSRQPADQLDQPINLRAVRARTSGSRNLNERKPQLSNAAGDFLGHRLGIAEPRGVIEQNIRAVVALERAAPAGLNVGRRKSPEIVADAEFFRLKRRPVGRRQAVEIVDHAQLHGRMGPLENFVQLPQKLLRLALDDRDARDRRTPPA